MKAIYIGRVLLPNNIVVKTLLLYIFYPAMYFIGLPAGRYGARSVFDPLLKLMKDQGYVCWLTAVKNEGPSDGMQARIEAVLYNDHVMNTGVL